MAAVVPGYPRLMAMNIGDPAFYGEPEYQAKLAKYDVVVLNFWPKWMEWKFGPSGAQRTVKAIKARNPSVLIGQYTNLNEAKPVNHPDNVHVDLARKLDGENWWLMDSSGNRQQWSADYGNFDINITAWVRLDTKGSRYPQWYAERNEQTFFGPIPEFDFWYLDNSLSRSPVQRADWDLDGRSDSSSDPQVARAYRLGHVMYWQRIRSLQTSTLLVGNSDDLSSPEYSGQLNGAFMEALIGKSWSAEQRFGWERMMARYRETMNNVADPKLVGFGVFGRADDYQRLRYGLASCLLDDGYFAYSDSGQPYEYGGVAWFDEFDVDLGAPVVPPATKPWRSGVFRRDFQHGMALVNPTRFPVDIDVEPGYRKIKGRQDVVTNDGKPVTRVRLAGRDGIILLKANP